MNKKNNLTIIIGLFVVVLVGIAILFYVNLEKNNVMEVEATIKTLGDGYIIATSDDGEEYSIKTADEYCIGDRIDFIIKDMKDTNGINEVNVSKIDIISKNISFSITDGNEECNDVDNNEVVVDNEVEDNTERLNDASSETNVINYFTNLDNKLDTYTQDKSIGDSLKQGFVTIVDFLFYDGTINGQTFDSLSSKAKIEVLKIALSIDAKIDKYFPGYKEKISTTSKDIYTSLKSKIVEVYLDLTTKLCNSNEETCNTAKEGLKDLKTSFSLTWEFIKEIGINSITKLKEWYEVWKTV